MRSSIHIAAILCTLALPPATFAQASGATVTSSPGRVELAQAVEGSAVITAIDKANRTFTVKRQKGEDVKIKAGPEVRNFDQLKVGDTVNVAYVESLVLELKKGGGMKVEKTEKAGVMGAKPGEAPAGVAGRQVTVVGDVIKLDPATQIITVKGPERTVELKSRDPEQFKRIAVGDQIQATYTEALAVSVTPAAATTQPKK